MTSPTTNVSVVIPVFNGEAYLAEAVQSVVDQTHPALEIIVVDDGSTDATAAVARELPVRYNRQPNAGPGAAMNTGVELVAGELLSFLSADDLWVADKLENQLAALHAPDGPDAVFGHVQHFLSPEIDPEVAKGLRCPREPKPASSAGTLLIPTETFRRVGPFDPQFRVGEFFDWFARATDQGLTMAILPEVVSRRRVHEANHSLVSDAPTAGYARVLKTIRDRRRAQESD